MLALNIDIDIDVPITDMAVDVRRPSRRRHRFSLISELTEIKLTSAAEVKPIPIDS